MSFIPSLKVGAHPSIVAATEAQEVVYVRSQEELPAAPTGFFYEATGSELSSSPTTFEYVLKPIENKQQTEVQKPENVPHNPDGFEVSDDKINLESKQQSAFQGNTNIETAQFLSKVGATNIPISSTASNEAQQTKTAAQPPGGMLQTSFLQNTLNHHLEEKEQNAGVSTSDWGVLSESHIEELLGSPEKLEDYFSSSLAQLEMEPLFGQDTPMGEQKGIASVYAKSLELANTAAFFEQSELETKAQGNSEEHKVDGFLTESELLTSMSSCLGSDSPAETKLQEFEALKRLLSLVRTEGLAFSPSLSETSEGKNHETKFDQASLQTLEEHIFSNLHEVDQKKWSERAETIVANGGEKPSALSLAVFGYTTRDYKELNAALRSDSVSEEQQLYIDGISEGLRELPSHQGIVWRGARIPDEIIAQYKPGTEVVEKAFTSTSYGTEAAFGGKALFCIQLKEEGSAGKKVDHLAAFEGEQEVLIDAGTRFKVLATEDTLVDIGTSEKQERVIIYLQEV